MTSCSKDMRWVCLFLVLLLLILSAGIGDSLSRVDTLPGYPGKLPFTLETGYVGVGEAEDLQLFYYFIESERNPRRDPLILWLTGGPGCSGLSGLLYEIGPLTFDYENFTGELPTLLKNPYSWTQVANIIFLDAPVGTGFSYANSSEGYNTSDTKSAAATYEFLRKWMIDHPKFKSNPLYITGDSYSGIVLPIIVDKLADDNKARVKPPLNLQGYVLGNPVTDIHKDGNAVIPYVHRVGLIPDEYYKTAKNSCKGEYVYPDPNNAQCVDVLLLIDQCTANIYTPNILEPNCGSALQKTNESYWGTKQFFEDDSIDTLRFKSQHPELWCRTDNYILSYIWANDPAVQEALHIRNGTIIEWLRCNKSLSYEYDIENVVGYHLNLSKKVHRALIYSGDHDMIVPYLSTNSWITWLNITVSDSWRPWFVDGQVAGYTVKYLQNGFSRFGLTYATVKGGGHTAPEYKPKQCLNLVDRWFAHYNV